MNPELSVKKEKKELAIFLMIAYGLTFFMAIPMAMLSSQGKSESIFSFALAQMLYPAAGLMLAKLVCEKEDTRMPRTFFLGFLTLTGFLVLWCFAGFFWADTILSWGRSILLGIGAVVIAILYFKEKEENRSAYGLLSKNWKPSILLIILFVVLTYGGSFVFMIATKNWSGLEEFSPYLLLEPFLILPLAFIINFPCFLGEEYGWRCYFQPLLQKKFGLIKGVILFGILWEFWHLPLVIFYYSPQTPNMSPAQVIVFRYSNVILLAIFMAYAYMRTENVWLPVFIHYVNNGLASGEDNVVYTWGIIILLILIKMALYIPFLFTKVFREKKDTGEQNRDGEKGESTP